MTQVRIAFAIVLVLAFGMFAVFLVRNADTTNPSEWDHWVYVFGAIEAPAFAAIGWVFGREVNRERAEKAEDRASAAEAEKDTVNGKGHKLAGMVMAASGGAQGRQRLEAQGAEAGADPMAKAAEYASQAFPV